MAPERYLYVISCCQPFRKQNVYLPVASSCFRDKTFNIPVASGYVDPAIEAEYDDRKVPSIGECGRGSGLDVDMMAYGADLVCSSDMSQINEEIIVDKRQGQLHSVVEWHKQDCESLPFAAESIPKNDDCNLDESSGHIVPEPENLSVFIERSAQADRIDAGNFIPLHQLMESADPNKPPSLDHASIDGLVKSAEYQSPTAGFYSCCLPWLQEELNLKVCSTVSLIVNITMLSCISGSCRHLFLVQQRSSDPGPDEISVKVAVKSDIGEEFERSRSNPAVSPTRASVLLGECAQEGARSDIAESLEPASSPACAPVSALVWAAANESESGKKVVGSENTESSAQNYSDPSSSPACGPVSALIWAAASESAKKVIDSENDETFAQNHSNLSSSPACGPVSALVWAEVSGTASLDSGHGFTYNSDIHSLKFSAQTMSDSPSPICGPVSALVLGGSLASADTLIYEKATSNEVSTEGSITEPNIVEDIATGYEDNLSNRNASIVNFVVDSEAADPSRASNPRNETKSVEMSSQGNGRIVSSYYDYDGEIPNDRPHGWGFQRFKDASGELSGLTYRGNFVDGLAHCRRGVAVWSNGLEFKGEFIMGCPTCGSLTEPDGQEHSAVFSRDGRSLRLWEIAERHIIEALQDGREGRCGKKGGIDGSRPNKESNRESSAEKCGSEYVQQFDFLRNLFPDCENLVLADLLRDCEGDVEKAIEFLLPAEPVRSSDEQSRSKRFRAIILPHSVQAAASGKQKQQTESEWAAPGGLAGRLNDLAKQQQLLREFPGVRSVDVKEALAACGGDLDEARQQLLIMDISKEDFAFADSRIKSTKVSAGHTSIHYKHSKQGDGSHYAKSRAPSNPVSAGHTSAPEKHPRDGDDASEGRIRFSDAKHDEGQASMSSEKEVWRLSKSRRAREAGSGSGASARERKFEAQYEDMSGPELRRLGFQHAKMHADLSRMAVSAFQAGDRIQATRLSEKARHHQEQYQTLNEMARTKIIEEFNPDMDASMRVDLHQLHVAEALELLATKLRQWSSSAGGRRLLVDVVTGAGNHSREGKAVLRPRVKAWLEERGMRYYPINDGLLKVDLSTFPQG